VLLPVRVAEPEAAGRHITKVLALALTLLGGASVQGWTDEPPPLRKDFRGTWAGDAHCRWSDIFMLVYDRRTVSLPHRNAQEPGLDCRILSVHGKRPEWKLKLSCRTWESPSPLTKRFELRQTLTLSNNGFEMVVETEPFWGNPARREEVRYCRGANDPPPPLMCFDNEKGHTVPCDP